MVDSALERRRSSVCATILYWTEQELPLVERCIQSLIAQSVPSADLHILAIDNGTGLTPRLSQTVQLLRLPKNLGFAGGHNAGMRSAMAAGADFVFLINSDVVLDTHCLTALLEVATRRTRAGIFGPLILSECPAGYVESNGLTFSSWSGRHRQVGRGRLASAVDSAPHIVDAVSGAAMLVRRSVLERVGLLDESLFSYFEDVDLCLRAARAGFEICVAPQAIASHIGGGSTAPDWSGRTFYSVRNHLVVAARNARKPWSRVLPFLVLGYHLAFLLRKRERRTRIHLEALIRGALAAWTNRMGAVSGLADRH